MNPERKKGSRFMKYIIPLVFSVLLSGCYTIVTQPSVLPEDIQSTLDAQDSNAVVTNNYYYYNGMYYNRPFYADRRYMRYNWFMDGYYFDPYYYNSSYYYDDMRWYHFNRHPHYSYGYDGYNGHGGSGVTVPAPEKERRTNNFGRTPGNPGSSSGNAAITAPDDPRYILAPATGSGSSGASAGTSGNSGSESVKKSSQKAEPTPVKVNTKENRSIFKPKATKEAKADKPAKTTTEKTTSTARTKKRKR